jgi:kynurenine 3-monooxygenase
MSTGAAQRINIVGAGLAGALLAVMLARRGLTVHLSERRADPRRAAAERGRSINLALAARGIAALEHAGVMEQVRELLIPMRGRMIHDEAGHTELQPYGQQRHEVIWSVGRGALNRVLIEAAATCPGVSFAFGRTCVALDPGRDLLQFRHAGPGAPAGDSLLNEPLTPTIATDGAGSAVRHSLVTAGHVTAREEWLDHDYKELTIPAATARQALDPNALHIWPRGGFMLIALPNTDGSFTATLFLPRTGANSFAQLAAAAAVLPFFQGHFPDAARLMPSLEADFQANPTGQMATVHTDRWHLGGQVLLLGDAAHAIVPFHGQGMNAAFEDCRVLDSLPVTEGAWAELFSRFEEIRRPNTEAIAHMALENYTEMRSTVLDRGFVRRKTLALELERHFPRRFIPRYAMVMFHPEIPYAEALRRGAVQEEILAELDADSAGLGATDAVRSEARRPIDLARAQDLISRRLPELAPG